MAEKSIDEIFAKGKRFNLKREIWEWWILARCWWAEMRTAVYVVFGALLVLLAVSMGASAQNTNYLQQWQQPSRPNAIYQSPQGPRYNVYAIPNQPAYRWQAAPQYGTQSFYFTPRRDAQFSGQQPQPGFHSPTTQWGR